MGGRLLTALPYSNWHSDLAGHVFSFKGREQKPVDVNGKVNGKVADHRCIS